MSQTPPSRLSFYRLLEEFRRRPGMFIGHKSLHGFRGWLAGYEFGTGYEVLDNDAEWVEFRGFDEFVQDRYDWHDVGGWAAKIAYYHRNDAEALDEFFRLLDEFRAARPGLPADQSGPGERPED